MTKPIIKKITEFSAIKAFAFICCGIALSLAILSFSNWVTTPNKHNPDFSYGTSENPNDIIHVIDNKRVEVPLIFTFSQGISEVSLEFSGEHGQIAGLTMSAKTVEVVNGKAISKVLFQFNQKTALKAGTHFLTVTAKDTTNGEVISKGVIRFTYNMHEVIGKCSC